MRRRTRGFTLVEVLVALGLVAGGAAALLGLTIGDARALALTEERLLATHALDALRAGFGGRPLGEYRDRGFPPRFEEFTPLAATLLEDHPATASDADSPVDADLARRAAVANLRRAVLFEPTTTPEGLDAGIVTFVVRYTGAGGAPRELRAREIVY